MPELLILPGAVVLAMWALDCLLMLLFASRLPDGTAAPGGRVPARLRDDRPRLRQDPDVPRRAKVALRRRGVGLLADRPAAGVPARDRPLDDVVAVVLLLR